MLSKRNDLVKTAVPRLPYEALANEVLGNSYETSLVFIGDMRARALNRKWRAKDTPANVLAFPLGEKSGEIFINIAKAKCEAAREGVSLPDRTAFLFIHALLHLKGLNHGTIMETQEDACMRLYRRMTAGV